MNTRYGSKQEKAILAILGLTYDDGVREIKITPSGVKITTKNYYSVYHQNDICTCKCTCEASAGEPQESNV